MKKKKPAPLDVTGLKQRILANMDAMLAVIDNENGGRCQGDFRHWVLGGIRQIAEFEEETMTPFYRRRQLDSFAKSVKRAALLAAELSPGVLHVDVASLNELAARANKAEVQPGKTRRQLAAELACEIIEDYASSRPSLNVDGAYVALAGLMFDTATDVTGSDLFQACRDHFKALANPRPLPDDVDPADYNDTPLNLYRKPKPPPRPFESECETAYQQRVADRRNWRPLQQLLDTFFG